MAFIGISGSIIKDQSGLFAGYKRAYVNDDYIQSVINAGGTPVIIPVTTNLGVLEEIVSKLDGLILSGGHDVNPKLYGENPLRKLGEIFPERDSFDFALIELAKKRAIPILGICRGTQILNVFHGGSLYQDLEYRATDLPIGHSQKSGPTIQTHSIKVDKDSKLYSIIKEEEVYVNSFHHQVLKNIGKGLKVVAKAEDGVPEVIELTEYPWLIGVQFHPEMLHGVDNKMQDIFNAFVEATK